MHSFLTDINIELNCRAGSSTATPGFQSYSAATSSETNDDPPSAAGTLSAYISPAAVSIYDELSESLRAAMASCDRLEEIQRRRIEADANFSDFLDQYMRWLAAGPLSNDISWEDFKAAEAKQ